MEAQWEQQIAQWHQKKEHKNILRFIEAIPEHDRTYTHIGYYARAWNNVDEYEKAEAALRAVAEQGKDDPLWWGRLGYALYYQNRYAEALDLFEQALVLDPDDSFASEFRSMCRSGMQQAASRSRTPSPSDANSSVQAEQKQTTEERHEEVEAILLQLEADAAPFQFVAHRSGNVSMLLGVGAYKAHIFDTRAEEGFEGNGYDWCSIAELFLAERLPAYSGVIRFDPEADMFVAYTNDVKAMDTFARAFHAMCEDEEQLQELFSRAELD